MGGPDYVINSWSGDKIGRVEYFLMSSGLLQTIHCNGYLKIKQCPMDGVPFEGCYQNMVSAYFKPLLHVIVHSVSGNLLSDRASFAAATRCLPAPLPRSKCIPTCLCSGPRLTWSSFLWMPGVTPFVILVTNTRITIFVNFKGLSTNGLWAARTNREVPVQLRPRRWPFAAASCAPSV